MKIAEVTASPKPVPDWFQRGRVIADIETDPAALEAEVIEFAEWEELEAWEWRECQVPVPVLPVPTPNEDFGGHPLDPERLESLRGLQDHRPVIIHLWPNGTVQLLDGWHRVGIARERRQPQIRAVVGYGEEIRDLDGRPL